MSDCNLLAVLIGYWLAPVVYLAGGIIWHKIGTWWYGNDRWDVKGG